jgi:hypothetical protein
VRRRTNQGKIDNDVRLRFQSPERREGSEDYASAGMTKKWAAMAKEMGMTTGGSVPGLIGEVNSK